MSEENWQEQPEEAVATSDTADLGEEGADPVPENTLPDEERKVQEAQEAQAAELAPGETLPWVAPTPSAVQPAPPAEDVDEPEDSEASNT